MKTINKNITNEITIKNSKFITLLIKISSPNITNILEKINNDFPKATHYCYAYIYNEVKRFSDDGEPGGTAGMPILNVLEKENLIEFIVNLLDVEREDIEDSLINLKAQAKIFTEENNTGTWVYLDTFYVCEKNNFYYI